MNTRVRCAALVLSAWALVGAAACSRTSAGASSYKDTLPPPEEPMVMDGEIGRYGGRLVVQGDTAPATFNPVNASTVGVTEIMSQLFVSLTRFDALSQDEVPALAKSWDVSADGLTWRFHLRKGAQFSDGHPITSDDVLFSFAAVYDPSVPAQERPRVSTNGKPWDVSTPDPHTVVIRTPAPIGTLPMLTSGVRIVPRHVLEPALKAGTFASSYGLATPAAEYVSSGPWRLKEFAPGEKTVLARNPYWFGADREGHRLPYLDELVFLIVPDKNAADLKFRARELDAIPNPAPENYKWYEDHQLEGDFTLHDMGPRFGIRTMWFNLARVKKGTAGKATGTPHVGTTKYAWFNNAVFRRAVSMAIDRDAMIKSIFYGDAVKNWSTTTAGDKRWYTPGVVHYDYDPAGARRLLASLDMRDRDGDGVIEDGGGHPVAFSLKTGSSNAAAVATANFVRDDLARVGVALTIVSMDVNALVNSVEVDFDYDAALIGFSFRRPDPSQSVNIWRSSGMRHVWNPRQPSPATPEEAHVDQLMDAVIATADVAKRQARWMELQNEVNEQGWIVWLPTEIQKTPVRNRFGNVHPTAALGGANGVLWNAPEIFVKSR